MTHENVRSVVTSFFVEEHDALLLHGDFTPLLREFDLHLLSCGLVYDNLSKQLLADGLVCMALHLLTRPGDENIGWTISIQNPPENLFFVGHSGRGTVAGRAFPEGVKERDKNLFVSQTRREGSPQHQSAITVEGIDIFAMVERYYEQSEQKLTRFFHEDVSAALVQALPGGDREWLGSLDDRSVFALLGSPGVRRLCARDVMFRCGCQEDRVLDVVAASFREDVDGLFGGESKIEVQCPRCGARYEIGRDRFEAYVARKGKDRGKRRHD